MLSREQKQKMSACAWHLPIGLGMESDPSRVKPADTESIHTWVIVTFGSILTPDPRKVFFWA